MEFGHLDDLSGVDWPLPPDDLKRMASRSVSQEARIFFGSPAWGCKQWLGKIYPPKTPTEKFLSYYSRNFTCIELNTSHYRIPSVEVIKEWLAEVPKDFIFCPKLHKDISHSRFGLTDKALLKSWFDFLENVGQNLGPCFIQFHERFSYHDKGFLFEFLEMWPREFKLSVELRHSSWFQNNTILPALGDYLHKKGIGLVITDVAGRRDVLHGSVTAPWTMIRLIGNDLAKSDSERLTTWAKRLKQWQMQGVDSIYFFLHQPDDIWTIEFAQMAEKIFDEEGFSDIPHFKIEKQRDLFNL
ncbi:MAG: DUF72 domain-containing protein [Bacteriovoracaceae bacterium]